MFILDYPGVSDYLRDTVIRNGFPVLDTPTVRNFIGDNANYLTNIDAERILSNGDFPRIYTNSENSLEWLYQNVSQHRIVKNVVQLKDKYEFRKIISNMNEGLYYSKVSLAELKRHIPGDDYFPVVIKPTIGFYSLGVRVVSESGGWLVSVDEIQKQIQQSEGMFPRFVFDSAEFIIEGFIHGEEYAVDAYYDKNGEAVVMSIYHHRYSDGDDVRDRVYTTSTVLIQKFKERFSVVLNEMGKRFDLKNFPVHAELRVTPEGRIIPIEINPLRFGGWCSTPDLTQYAYGFNPYEYFMSQKKPDWENIIASHSGKEYSVIGLDNSTGYPGIDIQHFDYEALLSKFTRLLEIRKADYKKYSAFGMLFVETDEFSSHELDYFLHSDLSEFVNT